MKKICAISAAAALAWLFLAAGCGSKSGQQHFGEPFTDAPQATIEQLLSTPDDYARKPVRVKGLIERQCPATGCWFFINDDKGNSLKVELGDYLPKLPQHIGDNAEVEGEVIRKGAAYEFIGTRVTFSKKQP